ncbi:porin [Thalassolituus sp.]|uniref:porin n=1 Tax=Thalassolituus sp. TaxID=2030822 RepID=UPI003514A3F3
MKKTALFVAMAAATTFAQAETVEIPAPTFYGKMNVTQEFVQQEDAGNYSELNSNASRLGVKGNFALNDEITAFYQAEFQIGVDGDQTDKVNIDGETVKYSSAFTKRNTFIGAKGSFGKVQAGIFDSALKASQKKVDVFNDLAADIKNYVTNSDNRPSNVVRYQSPSLSGLVLTFDHINSEDETVANSQSMSAAFTQDMVYVAVAHDIGVEGAGIDVTRVVGQLNLDGGIQLGALWETEDDNGESNDGMMVSAAVKAASKVTLKGQYASSDIRSEGATQITLGADYKLAKNAKVFGYVSDAETDADSSGVQVFAVGAEYKF